MEPFLAGDLWQSDRCMFTTLSCIGQHGRRGLVMFDSRGLLVWVTIYIWVTVHRLDVVFGSTAIVTVGLSECWGHKG